MAANRGAKFVRRRIGASLATSRPSGTDHDEVAKDQGEARSALVGRGRGARRAAEMTQQSAGRHLTMRSTVLQRRRLRRLSARS